MDFDGVAALASSMWLNPTVLFCWKEEPEARLGPSDGNRAGSGREGGAISS